MQLSRVGSPVALPSLPRQRAARLSGLVINTKRCTHWISSTRGPDGSGRQQWQWRALPDSNPPLGATGGWEEQPLVEWGTARPEDSDLDELDLFPEPRGEPEFQLQNALGVTLLALLALAGANVFFKLAFVTYALVSAAFRYVAIGILMLVLLTYFD